MTCPRFACPLAEVSGDLISAVQSPEDLNASVVSSLHGQEVRFHAARNEGKLLILAAERTRCETAG